jgi:SAM-dependent methyltransferase
MEIQSRLAVFRDVLEAELPEFDPWLYRYCGDLTEPAAAERYMKHLIDMLEFAEVDPDGIDAVDAGSGFGFTLIALALLGANHARGVEIYDRMVETCLAYAHLLPDDVRERIDVYRGSVSEMPYDDDSADLVVSNEAISHYRDVDAFILEAHRVLRPGGCIIVADGNNGRNPWIRRKTRDLWDAFELGPTETDVVHGVRVEHRYQAEREQFVRRDFPEVPAERMARETFSMTFPEIADACRRYIRDGSFPGSIYDRSTVPLNPNDGTVIERLFDPYELAKRFERVGFTTKTRGYWGGASGRPVLRVANSVLALASPLTIFTARAFRIAARKT